MGRTLAETLSLEDYKHVKSSLSEWEDQLNKTSSGKICSDSFNVILILNNDENLKNRFSFNLLTRMPEINGDVPWERLDDSCTLSDHDDSCLRNYLSIHYGIRSKDIIFDALNQVVMENKRHPVRDYLNSIKGSWDGVPRLDTLLIDFFDADDTELNRWQTRLSLVAAVKRAFKPGCKMDYVLTLKGDQGVGKSSFFSKISVKDEWFSDSVDDLKGKEAKEQIQGKWIIELGEMAAVGKGDQKRIKQFIASQADEFRQSYGRRTSRYPRQCVFFATTNDEHPLKDDTGGRRWWIVDVKSKWFEKDFALNVDQIWAEAFHIYEFMESRGEPLVLPQYLEEQAKKIQSENTDMGLYSEKIRSVLQKGYVMQSNYPGTLKVSIDETCAIHVWEVVLERQEEKFTSHDARNINAVLKSLEDWECVGRRNFKNYGKVTLYKRK